MLHWSAPTMWSLEQAQERWMRVVSIARIQVVADGIPSVCLLPWLGFPPAFLYVLRPDLLWNCLNCFYRFVFTAGSLLATWFSRSCFILEKLKWKGWTHCISVLELIEVISSGLDLLTKWICRRDWPLSWSNWTQLAFSLRLKLLDSMLVTEFTTSVPAVWNWSLSETLSNIARPRIKFLLYRACWVLSLHAFQPILFQKEQNSSSLQIVLHKERLRENPAGKHSKTVRGYSPCGISNLLKLSNRIRS